MMAQDDDHAPADEAGPSGGAGPSDGDAAGPSGLNAGGSSDAADDPAADGAAEPVSLTAGSVQTLLGTAVTNGSSSRAQPRATPQPRMSEIEVTCDSRDCIGASYVGAGRGAEGHAAGVEHAGGREADLQPGPRCQCAGPGRCPAQGSGWRTLASGSPTGACHPLTVHLHQAQCSELVAVRT